MTRGPTREELLGAALAYVARGWAVLPLHYPTGDGCSCVIGKGVGDRCDDEGKHPAVTRGALAATTDPALLRRWWERRSFNVGVATGRGLLVVDIDPRHGGDESIDDLQARHGRLPSTAEACTGGGGRHLLFRAEGYLPCSVGKLGRGIDVRGDGGLIVAPPSLHASGRVYGWELSSDPAEIELAEAPEWLLGLCRAPGRAPRRVGARGRGKAVKGEPIPEGERNATLYRVACSLRAKGLDEDELADALADENNARCEPPLGWEEVEAIASKASRHIPGLSPAYERERARGEASFLLSQRVGVRFGDARGSDVPTPPPDLPSPPLEEVLPAQRAGGGSTAALVLPSPPATHDASPSSGGAGGVVERAAEVLRDGLKGTFCPAAPSMPSAFLHEILGDLVGVEGEDWARNLTRGRKGSIESTLGNTFLVLRHDRTITRQRPRFNELTLFAEIGDQPVTDTVLTALRTKVEQRWSFTPAKGDMEDALRLSAELDGYHPVRQYLEGLTWDGVPRINDLASEVFGADPDEPLYARFVACFFLGAVRRVFTPGCMHQSVFTLVGNQGMMKSAFFRALGAPWFNESKIEVGEKDGAMKTHSAWIHEFPEVEQITLFREAALVKSFITTAIDTFRPPYARNMKSVPRSSIFGATTNQPDFLRDETGTGSRRWHPLPVTRVINGELVASMRDQLWAEAVVRARTSEPAHLSREEERRREELARDFYQTDPWEGLISRWLPAAPEVHFVRGIERFAVTTTDLLTHAIGMRRADPGVGEARRLGGLMRRLGWERTRQRFPIGKGPSRRLGEPEWGYASPAGWKPIDGAAAEVDQDFPAN